MSEVRSVEYAPHADAARPVLHFTGRADMEATLRALLNDENTTYADLARYMRIEHTLHTGAAP